jgi:adenylate cyclase
VTGNGVERRLAAILSADVVGYSRLMEADEEATIRALSTCRQNVDELVASHHGRVFSSAGDSVIAEFASAVEAVRCAAEIQRHQETQSADLPEDRRMRLRIGINLGDIVVEDGNLLGDGVNVAARLEGLAEPGGLCISANIHEQVAGKLDLVFDDLGEQTVKNITRPVRAYRVLFDNPICASAASSSEPLSLPDKPSVAVLPFTNMSGDPEQEHFSDGMTEDIITELTRFRSLFVIARNSSFAYKGQSVNVGKIGQELGVVYVVEGSVRKAGNRVRITAQLIDAATGNHLWAERYDRDLEDIFAVQDEVTNAIVTAIEPTLGSAERDRALRKPTESLDAWENCQRGLGHLYRFAAQENTEAQSFFRRAIELDPNFAPAHAGLAYAIYMSFALGFVADPASVAGEARAAAQRAVTLDSDDALAHAVVARVHLMLGEHDAAISACETALALNPNLAMAHFSLGSALTYSGHYEEAIVELDEAIRLSPRDPMLSWILTAKALANIAMERYEEGLEITRASQRQPNAGVWAYVDEVAALAQLDRIEEARQALERVRAIKPDFDLNFAVSTLQQMRFVGRELYIDGLKKAGLEN